MSAPIFEYGQKYFSDLGIKHEIWDKKSDLLLLSKGHRRMFFRGYNSELNGFLSSKIVNNKKLTKRILSARGIPVPRGFAASTINMAKVKLRKSGLKYPLVVKPVDGNQGKAVMANINRWHWFKLAADDVHCYNRQCKGKPGSFLVEDYISGDDLRFIVLDGHVLTALRRTPAYVIGNGRDSISKLIAAYNTNGDIGPGRPLCPIVNDRELRRNLRNQKLNMSSVIPAKQKIYLRQNANVSTGGRSFECLKQVNKRYRKLAIEITQLFNLRFCAVDIIAKDITKYQDFAVIEVNHSPGFDIHEKPYRGRPFPVAKHVLQAIFAPKKNKPA